jgi:hypothetical protein
MMNHAPTTATITLAVLLLSTAAHGEQWNARCAVFRGDQLIEKSLCQRTILRDGSGVEEGGTHIIRYQWQSGGKTITENQEEDFRINGKQGKTVMVQKGYGLCVKNLASGNTFCTKF